mgnify:FL=1
MFDKDEKPENKFFSPKWEPESEQPKEESKPEQPEEEGKPFTVESNDPNAPMRRKNRVLNDGKDWFDTHPDA